MRQSEASVASDKELDCNNDSSSTTSPLTPITTDRLPATCHYSHSVGLCIKDGTVLVKSIKRKDNDAEQKMTISPDGLAVCVQKKEQVARQRYKRYCQLFSLQSLPEQYYSTYKAASTFVSWVKSVTPKVSLNLKCAKACLMESSKDFVVTFNLPNGSACWHYMSERGLGFCVEHIGDCDPSFLTIDNATVHRLSKERIRHFCETLFLWQECIRIERSLATHAENAFPVHLGNYSSGTDSNSDVSSEYAVSAFICEPRVGWALRICDKKYFVLFLDFTSVMISKRMGDTTPGILLTDSRGRQREFSLTDQLPREFKCKLGPLLLMMRKIISKNGGKD